MTTTIKREKKRKHWPGPMRERTTRWQQRQQPAFLVRCPRRKKEEEERGATCAFINAVFSAAGVSTNSNTHSHKLRAEFRRKPRLPTLTRLVFIKLLFTCLQVIHFRFHHNKTKLRLNLDCVWSSAFRSCEFQPCGVFIWCEKMQEDNVTDFQLQWGSLSSRLSGLYEDPKVNSASASASVYCLLSPCLPIHGFFLVKYFQQWYSFK